MRSESVPEDREIYAVLGSPASRVSVRAPEERREARRMKAGNTFYCSSALGGCGGELTFAVGDVNVPHFRHRSGSKCALISSDTLADRYTHLAIQEALRAWIERMPEFTCRLEVSIENGRTDVLASGPSFEVSLEVQRSQLSARQARERTARYGQRADAVHWLYAYRDIDAYKAELADRGWSLRIWWGWAKRECRIGASYECGEETEAEVKEVGGPLGDWSITARGLDSPHLRKAKRAVEDRRALERDRARQEAEAAAELEAAKREREAAARRRQAEWQRASREALLQQLGRSPEGTEKGWPTSWPDLRGSAKQVAWAGTIRAQIVGGLRDELLNAWLPEERVLPVVQWLALQEAAHFWIHSRWSDSIDVVRMYEHKFGTPAK